MVFFRISSIFDPQAIFRVELLPCGGQAHRKMDCILTPAFIGSRCRIRGARQHLAKQHAKNGTSPLKRAYFLRSVSDFNEIFLVES